MTEFIEDLRLLSRSPSPSVAEDDFVARVMSACAEPPQGRAARRFGAPAYACAALATAAALALLATRPQPLDAPGGSVAARGAGKLEQAPTVQAFVGRSRPGVAPALLEGAELGPGDGIVVRYSNPTARDAYLMVFALDERGDVHWIHPAYLNESESPMSLRLEQRVTLRVLDEVAEPENPAPGPLRVYGLLSSQPLGVKDVEAKLSGGHATVSELFPQVEVEEWRCTWRAR